MPHIDARSGEVVIRIVYDGAPEAGKTTNVAKLGTLMSLQRVGAAKKPGTSGDRTEFFDWLDFTGGYLDGRRVRCQLVSVPGQSRLLHRRRYLLEKADAIVFVADSRPPTFEDSIHNFSTTVRMVEQLGGPIPVGVILQANKQDLPHALTPPEVAKHIGTSSTTPVIGSIASRGDGVMQTFILAVRLATDRVRALLLGDDMAALEEHSDSPEALFAAMLELEKKMVASAAAVVEPEPPDIEIVTIDDSDVEYVEDEEPASTVPMPSIAVPTNVPIPPTPSLVSSTPRKTSSAASIELAARHAAETAAPEATGIDGALPRVPPPLPPPPAREYSAFVSAARKVAEQAQAARREVSLARDSKRRTPPPLEDALEAAWDQAVIATGEEDTQAPGEVDEPSARPADERAAREQAVRDEAAREVAERRKAARAQAERDRGAREQAERERFDREQVAREQAAREQAAREQEAREVAAREQAAREQEAREQAAREQAERERAELEQAAAREQAAREQEAREQAAREQAERERAELEQAAVREQEARELAAREKAAREQAAREQAAREQAERARAELEQAAARELAAREQAAREQAAREQAAREQAAREQEAREQAAREQAAREQEARELAAREQAAREQAAREQEAREQAERERLEREQAAAHEQALRERARAIPTRRNPLRGTEIPVLPNAAEIASGHVWPPVKGRASVAVATSGRITVPELVQPWAPADAFELVSDTGWILHSSARWLYENEGTARHRLLGYVRSQISRGGGIPEGRTLAVAKDGEHWRLWLLTPQLQPLSQRIIAAIDTHDAAATSMSMKEVITAMRELRDLGLSGKEIAAGMSGLAVHDRRLAVLPLDEGDGEPRLEPRDPFAELVEVIGASVQSNAGLRRWFEDEGRIAIERASAQ